MDPYTYLIALFDSTGFEGRTKAANVRERFARDGTYIWNRFGRLSHFALPRVSLAKTLTRSEEKIRRTTEHWHRAGFIEPYQTSEVVTRDGEITRTPTRWAWTEKTLRFLAPTASLAAPVLVVSQPVAPAMGYQTIGQTTHFSGSNNPSKPQEVNLRLGYNQPLRCSSEAGYNQDISPAITLGGLAGGLADPGCLSPDPDLTPELLALAAEDREALCERLKILLTAKEIDAGTAARMVTDRLDALDRVRLAREAAARAAGRPTEPPRDRWHPDNIFARLKAEDEKAAGIMQRAHGAGEQEARLRAEHAERLRQGDLGFDRIEIPRLRPLPLYEPPVYRPVGRDEDYPDAWEANVL